MLLQAPPVCMLEPAYAAWNARAQHLML